MCRGCKIASSLISRLPPETELSDSELTALIFTFLDAFGVSPTFVTHLILDLSTNLEGFQAETAEAHHDLH